MTFGQIRLFASSISLAVFTGLFFPGGWSLPVPLFGEAPVSILASKCERLWLDEARNDPALECYLTSQTDRLCRESEKQHLLWFITRYQNERKVHEGKLWGYVLGVQVGMASPPQPGADGKRDGFVDHYTKVSAAQAAKLKADEAFVKAIKLRSLTDGELTALVRKLAVKAYITEDDFGWSSPSWVTDTFDGSYKVKPACVQPDA